MDILVTGGTVFVSRAVSEYFATLGDCVFVLNRGNRPQPEHVTLIRADRHDLGDKLKSYCFDAVLDMTAYTGEDVRKLCNALGDFSRYVLLSSSAVYPETLSQPFCVGQPTGFNAHWGDYGLGKIEAENVALEHIADAYIIRPPYLCGRGNNLYREAFVFECAEQGVPVCLPEHCDLQLQFCDISELCRLIERILTQAPEQHIFNLGDPKTVSATEWANACFAAAAAQPDIRFVPESCPIRSYFPFRAYNYRLDTTETEGISPYTVTLEQSLREGFAYWAEHRHEVAKKPYIDFIRDNLI